MHALIVVSHPEPKSLTHSVAAHLAEGIAMSGGGHSSEIADLTAEGFDPRYSATDHAIYLREVPTSKDVAAEQARIDRSDALVLVYPVYWWSMPGLLKGWIDRVFTNGWAYEEQPDGKVAKKLPHLPVHLIAIGGADMGTYERHGYLEAMKTQIDHGIFDYCGAPVVTSDILVEQAEQKPEASLEAAKVIGRSIFSSASQAAKI